MSSNMEMSSQGPDELERLLSLETFSELCSVSIWTVRKWVKDGKIRSVKLGARRLIPRDELRRIASDGLAA